jgi:hypothetical protein
VVSRAVLYRHSGHGVGTYPYLPAGTSHVHPVTNVVTEMGGTRAADEAARADPWPKVLALLAHL